jgi:hypothetical protein
MEERVLNTINQPNQPYIIFYKIKPQHSSVGLHVILHLLGGTTLKLMKSNKIDEIFVLDFQMDFLHLHPTLLCRNI